MMEMLEKNLVGHKNILCILCRQTQAQEQGLVLLISMCARRSGVWTWLRQILPHLSKTE